MYLAVLDRPPDEGRTDARGGLQGAARLFVFGGEPPGMQDLNLERAGLPDLDQEPLLGAESRHGVEEALSQRRSRLAVPDEHGERPGQRVEERRFVPAALVGPEDERTVGRGVGRAAAWPGSERIRTRLLPGRHGVLAAPLGTVTAIQHVHDLYRGSM
jgi:hypothetical protein